MYLNAALLCVFLLTYSAIAGRVERSRISLLGQLGAAYGTAERTRPLVAVLDNGPIHCSKLTTKALAQRPWLTLEWLPKYAPELNDIGDAGATSSSINSSTAPSSTLMLSPAPSLTLSPVEETQQPIPLIEAVALRLLLS